MALPRASGQHSTPWADGSAPTALFRFPTARPPSVIEVDQLTKHYGDLTAVDRLSFSVAPGEILGLVGPNGAGKTTTLTSLAGITIPTSGSIRIGGFDIAREGVKAKAQLAFIPDEPHLFDYLTVEEHLRFVGRLYWVADAAERIPPLLSELELTEKTR